ncbi:hypothetical protein GA0070607_4691 [Micromonospora coriariae]|uniref:Uncharacterized protein n=1 Tax=Micromonospora coriariae TaxID=285665 RepID=A0A1C4X5P5_9ACTN|nr:hypothetical protein GA0070607_4691 [Micromonospora coriariae]
MRRDISMAVGAIALLVVVALAGLWLTARL